MSSSLQPGPVRPPDPAMTSPPPELDVTSRRPPPPSPPRDGGHLPDDDYVEHEIDMYFDEDRSLTGEMWAVRIQCKGSKIEFVHFEWDRADMSFLNLIRLRGKLGYSSRSYMFYKKRVRNDVASLVLIDYESDVETMMKDNARERKVRLLLAREEPSNMQISITPLKRPREMANNNRQHREDPIDAYKVWLADMQAKANEQCGIVAQDDQDELQDEQLHPEYRDEYRIETIKTYTEWLRLQRKLSAITQYVAEETDGVRTPPPEEIHESNPSPIKWPSHARRPKKKGKDGKKSGRGTLKGISAAIRRIKNGTPKLNIEFSGSMAGPVGPNARAFVDDVVSYSRKRTPLIGVRSWKDIKQKVKNSIVSDVLHKWIFPNNVNAKEKILSIASERYKGWRSTFSATYKAHKTYHDRMKNKPEDVDIVEWHYLMLYFGTEKFQKVSQTNSENRKQQKIMHLMGSKPYSQYSYEQRDEETGEEPDRLTLFKMTHCKQGMWTNKATMIVHEEASAKVVHTELRENRLLPSEECNKLFQDTYKEITGCKTSKPPCHGYLAKCPTRRQLLNAQTEEEARASAAAQERNNELEARVKDLEQQLANEAAKHANEAAERERLLEEKTRQIQEEEKKAREALRDQLMAQMTSMLEKQKEEAAQKTNMETNMQVDNTVVRKTGHSKVHQTNVGYISSQQLRNAASKSRLRPREDTI